MNVVRTGVVMSGVAVAATGAVVAGGVISGPSGSAAATDAGSQVFGPVAPVPATTVAPPERAPEVSRSDRRTRTDPTKAVVLGTDTSPAVTHTEDLSAGDPRTVAKALLPEFGFGADQFTCLDSLYSGESGWRVNADNPYSSAYGIPQALPGSKMASAGPDWATNPATQIRWGLGYIADRYGTPCGAWGFKQSHGWY